MTEPKLIFMSDDWYDGRKKYGVFIDETLIGYVEQYKPTFERGSKYNNYVSTRWTSKTWHWVWWLKDDHRDFKGFQRVRKEAVRRLLCEHTRKLTVDD